MGHSGHVVPVVGGRRHGFGIGDEIEFFPGRNVQRNVAYVDLAFSSALRRREIGAHLVTDEIVVDDGPPVVSGRSPREGRAVRCGHGRADVDGDERGLASGELTCPDHAGARCGYRRPLCQVDP
jgi:hypothetical protein